MPEDDPDSLAFYQRITAPHPDIDVLTVPRTLTPAYLESIEDRPGLLALKIDPDTHQPVPYVVPGGRFNEMYGWDSYFIGLGLIAHDQYELARGMLENMAYQIRHYGRMLNANRSYYLSRSQPPFYTPYLRAFLDAYGDRVPLAWIREHLGIAIDEYENVWMNPQTHLTGTGLSRYYGEGKGRPKETEPGHFDFELKKYADRHGLDVREFERRYDSGEIVEPELDNWFVHDRSMRESGLDTTTRFDGVCASLACVDLNSILYRVETDLAALTDLYMAGEFTWRGASYPSGHWRAQAEKRRQLMKTFLWNEADGTWYDWNIDTQRQQPFVSASNLMPLWAGAATPEEARRAVASQLPQLLKSGGIASTGPIDKHNQPGPERQWDAPYGWAPHQIMIWEGLRRYGYDAQAQQAAFAWLRMLVRAAVEYNGLITEKFNVENSRTRSMPNTATSVPGSSTCRPVASAGPTPPSCWDWAT